MDAARHWEDAVLAFLRERKWNPSGSTLLLAVSGGADSTALLHFWARRAGELGCRLAAVHVDHRLRPASSLDRDFVAALCREKGVPCGIATLDPAARAPRESVEMWARRERYRCFAEAAERAGAAFVLTAHHRDDQVETVFQRLLRGTGPRGLSGIPFSRPLAGRGLQVVRPFLSRPRVEILAYLSRLGAAWREDESNADTRIERNWFRMRYLPALRREEPDLDARISALALRMRDLMPGLDALEETARLLRRGKGGAPYLPERALARRVAQGDDESLLFWLRRLAVAAGAPAGLVTGEILREFKRQWKESMDLQVPLSKTLALRRKNQGIWCEALSPEPRKRAREAKNAGSRDPQKVILEAGSGSHSWRWGDRVYRLSARIYPKPLRLVFPGSGAKRAIFDADLFSCTLLVRTRRDGDRFSPHGVRSKSRKLKVFFNEEKIPSAVRDEIPIVLAVEATGEETPAWVPGHGTSEFFKVSGKTTRVLELELEEECET